eukprot:scaffold15108_cov180-Amphora_coffeaeformis.AAC.49
MLSHAFVFSSATTRSSSRLTFSSFLVSRVSPVLSRPTDCGDEIDQRLPRRRSRLLSGATVTHEVPCVVEAQGNVTKL